MDMDNNVMYIYPKYRWKGEIRRHITSVYICMKCTGCPGLTTHMFKKFRKFLIFIFVKIQARNV